VDITRVINEIQRSNLDTAIISMACTAVQEYYQKLEAVGAIKKDVVKAEMEQVTEEVKDGDEVIKVTKSKRKAKKK